MNFTNECGTPTAVVGTTSGVGTIGAGNALNLLGVWVGGALTAQVLQLWTQTAAGALTGGVVLGTCTLAANNYYPIPAQFSRGLTYSLTNENTNITFFTVRA